MHCGEQCVSVIDRLLVELREQRTTGRPGAAAGPPPLGPICRSQRP
jgi:hypothetical protein